MNQSHKTERNTAKTEVTTNIWLNKIIPLAEIILIFIAALSFRVTNLDLIEFKADEATNLFLASRPLFGHPMPPATTASSVGILNPPLLNYLLYPLSLISLDPMVISGIIGLINAIAIVGFYLILKKYHNQTIAAISALLLSFSPWMILYSRKIWAQDFIFPVFVPLFYSLNKIIFDRDRRFWLPYTVFSLILVQLHQANILFLVPLTLFMFAAKVKIGVREIIIGLIIGLIPFIPYVQYEISHDCPDCSVIRSLGTKMSTRNLTVHFIRPLQITNQGNFQYELGDDMLTFKNNFPLAYYLRQFFYLEYLLIPAGMILFWRMSRKNTPIISATLLLPLTYYFLKVEQPMHYHIIIAPVIFMFLGYVLYRIITSKFRLISIAGIGVLILLLTTSVIFNYSLYALIRSQSGTKGDYGRTYGYEKERISAKLSPYRTDPAYPEMYLSNFINPRYFRGTDPVPRMLYPRSDTQKNLASLFTRLGEVPEDRRIDFELTSYFTDPPNIRVLRYLTKNSKNSRGYAVFLQEYIDIYLNYIQDRGIYYVKGKNLDISFEMPHTWRDTDEGQLIRVETGTGILYIHDQKNQLVQGSKIIKPDSGITVEIFPVNTGEINRIEIDQLIKSIGSVEGQISP
jgi:hypothetical protein